MRIVIFMDDQQQRSWEERLHALYPTIPEHRLSEAVANLDAYIEHVMIQYERICKDPKEYERFRALTAQYYKRYDDQDESLPTKLSSPPK